MGGALRPLSPIVPRRSPLVAAGPLALVPLAIQAGLVGSVGLGLLSLLLPAFGYLPALGETRFDLAPLRAALAYPGLGKAVGVTFASGLLATAAALAMALALVTLLDPLGEGAGPAGRLLQRAVLGVIATPHIAIAIGLAFLLSPSGWILRVAAAIVGIERPPDFLLLNDPLGLALTLALVIKETPFVIAVVLGALHRIDAAAQLRVGQSLGYTPGMACIKIVLPQVYRLIRLPILAVLAYGLSVADLSIVLGPDLPPTLPVLILRLLADPDLGNRLTAAGAGLIQIALVAAGFLLWRFGEAVGQRLWHRAVASGRRTFGHTLKVVGRPVLLGVGSLLLVLGLLAIAAILLWSVADVWRFPAIFPSRFSLDAWNRALGTIGLPLGTSLALAGVSTAIALAGSIACLELEDRIGHAAGRRGQWVLFLPLFAPEMGFLFGLQVAASAAGLGGTMTATLWFHLLFVFPYVFLTLSEPWRALDDRLVRTARCLGAGRWRVLLKIKAPILRAPLVLTAAVGFSVSLSLYLPTVLAGAGRITTLATETVTLYGGGDRRVLAVYSLLQAGLSVAAFAAAAFAARPRRFAGHRGRS